MFFLSCEYDTIKLGRIIGCVCIPGSLIYLQGEIGTGKTTLCKGFLRSLGYSGSVKSPTYTLVEIYETERCIVYHFDFYRIRDVEELGHIGIMDYFNDGSICVIEWADNGIPILPKSDITINLIYLDDGRQVVLESFSSLGNEILEKLSLQGFYL
ncbi:tRNA (adenosine(37)-N6)-threonylcarbamoyltransferase complex ATPase subunit type 1 TsaE [Blochmannia endosymbiont of Colobopsis nipponica]|uniref:tRNA (adenosine(37)-N6)-threonylcarbamoyltransferase complex ATPase subunit type 1 TsaE n=1 Tax=Blochmannia endosymbiont of Colobopsis nipponica TaxID=2681987 RepID=UPI001785A1CC|nr:tRNA (adenosine(37)-N6)-threonylcarbamoyltransferase complex ATPase subunit type 1 TsaE [Blochmannia endosymbiont of Colobopsis nipponica]QOI10776.1 tRNA (adenosine(37)-N6)-threonylcarbamoyltransferase complex ATPase subunit type 1 TsaE [Blochmannia endosymbiont of Colobopsis nipponica]